MVAGTVAGAAISIRSYRLVLASQSPRRRELLSDAGIEAQAIDPGLDDGELCRGQVAPSVWVASLAFLKARSGLSTRKWPDPVVVLGADTVCVLGERVLGQPADEAEAEAMIRGLSGVTHQVLTGVALVTSDNAEREVFVDRSIVRFPTLSEREITEYVASAEWRGKAGGYNISERIESGWEIAFEGDETSIMGLPMASLLPRLEAFVSSEPLRFGGPPAA